MGIETSLFYMSIMFPAVIACPVILRLLKKGGYGQKDTKKYTIQYIAIVALFYFLYCVASGQQMCYCGRTASGVVENYLYNIDLLIAPLLCVFYTKRILGHPHWIRAMFTNGKTLTNQ